MAPKAATAAARASSAGGSAAKSAAAHISSVLSKLAEGKTADWEKVWYPQQRSRRLPSSRRPVAGLRRTACHAPQPPRCCRCARRRGSPPPTHAPTPHPFLRCQDEALDTIYWIRQLIGVSLGILWGYLHPSGLVGFFGCGQRAGGARLL
jgi:hypothetical protein